MNTTVWLISFTTSNGERVQKVHTHNCVADYRLLVGGANVQEIDCAAVAELQRVAIFVSGRIFRWRTEGSAPSYREWMETEEMLDAAIARVGGAK